MTYLTLPHCAPVKITTTITDGLNLNDSKIYGRKEGNRLWLRRSIKIDDACTAIKLDARTGRASEPLVDYRLG